MFDGIVPGFTDVTGLVGMLYMGLGGTSSSGPENYPLAGATLSFNPDGSDLQAYARGLRNSYDLVFTSSSLVVATDHGPDEGAGLLSPDPPI